MNPNGISICTIHDTENLYISLKPYKHINTHKSTWFHKNRVYSHLYFMKNVIIKM